MEKNQDAKDKQGIGAGTMHLKDLKLATPRELPSANAPETVLKEDEIQELQHMRKKSVHLKFTEFEASSALRLSPPLGRIGPVNKT